MVQQAQKINALSYISLYISVKGHLSISWGWPHSYMPCKLYEHPLIWWSQALTKPDLASHLMTARELKVHRHMSTYSSENFSIID